MKLIDSWENREIKERESWQCVMWLHERNHISHLGNLLQHQTLVCPDSHTTSHARISHVSPIA